LCLRQRHLDCVPYRGGSLTACGGRRSSCCSPAARLIAIEPLGRRPPSVRHARGLRAFCCVASAGASLPAIVAGSIVVSLPWELGAITALAVDTHCSAPPLSAHLSLQPYAHRDCRHRRCSRCWWFLINSPQPRQQLASRASRRHASTHTRWSRKMVDSGVAARTRLGHERGEELAPTSAATNNNNNNPEHGARTSSRGAEAAGWRELAESGHQSKSGEKETGVAVPSSLRIHAAAGALLQTRRWRRRRRTAAQPGCTRCPAGAGSARERAVATTAAPPRAVARSWSSCKETQRMLGRIAALSRAQLASSAARLG